MKDFDEAEHLALIPDHMKYPDEVIGPVCDNCFDGNHDNCTDLNLGQYSCDCRNNIHWT